MWISKEDFVGGVVDGQSVGPLQFGRDDGADVPAIHANSTDIRFVAPVCPVQPSEKKRHSGKKKEGEEKSNNEISRNFYSNISSIHTIRS